MGAEIIPLDPSRRGRRRAARPRLAPADNTPPGLPLAAAWESWLVSMRARGLSERTIEVYRLVIGTFAAWLVDADECACFRALDEGDDRPCPAGAAADALGLAPGVEHITADHVRGYLAHRQRLHSPADAHKHFRTLRTLFSWLVQEGERSAPSPVSTGDEPIVGKKAHEPLTDQEIRALLRVCRGDSFEDRRDTAIIRVLLDNGMRVSGLVGLRYTPDDPETNDVHLSRYTLRIVLKGGDEHLAPIGRKAAAALDRYIRARARRPDASSSPWLWLGKKGRMTRSGVAQMLARRGEQAAIRGRVHPHRFRRTMAHWFLEADGDPLDLMRVAGWRSLAMVQHYTEELAGDRARAAHAKLSPGDRI